MQGNSSPVISNQKGLHDQLESTVRKHCATIFKRPIAAHAEQAWARLNEVWDGSAPLVLDSGCGTAQSTMQLAVKHSDSLVVGVDRSLVRLERNVALPANALLLRTNLEDLWRLMEAAGVTLSHHYILYPNPYPKAAQLRYRFHGSPVFPSILKLGGTITLRSNWKLYLEEFAAAATLVLPGVRTKLGAIDISQPSLTAFEQKYKDSQQSLYELCVQL